MKGFVYFREFLPWYSTESPMTGYGTVEGYAIVYEDDEYCNEDGEIVQLTNVYDEDGNPVEGKKCGYADFLEDGMEHLKKVITEKEEVLKKLKMLKSKGNNNDV